MRFKIATQLKYTMRGPSTLILNIHALRTASQGIKEEKLSVTPSIPCEEFYFKREHSRFVRLETGKNKTIHIDYRAQVEVSHALVPVRELMAVPVGKLDLNAIPYLFPSRYCQSDKLGRLAFNKFGKIHNPFRKVLAIADWIHENIEYLRGSTNSQTSAYDTVTERAGVCRDFAHLGIALCRALTIPARYVTGYAYQLQPPDFHACFEAYIGGRWLLFDPTHLAPLNGIVRIAVGRDAADAAVATIFGPAQCAELSVSCEAMEAGFTRLSSAKLANNGFCLDPS